MITKKVNKVKKILSLILVLAFFVVNIPAYALSEVDSIGLRDMRVQPDEPANAPRWTDYVPAKYQNPRTDFRRGKAIGELVTGIVLTDLIITCPIGIPMICHSTTKLKNLSYAEKKDKFFDGLEEARNMSTEEQEKYYNKLIKECDLKKQKSK